MYQISGTTTFLRCLDSFVESVSDCQASLLTTLHYFFSLRALFCRDAHNLANSGPVSKVGTQVL